MGRIRIAIIDKDGSLSFNNDCWDNSEIAHKLVCMNSAYCMCSANETIPADVEVIDVKTSLGTYHSIYVDKNTEKYFSSRTALLADRLEYDGKISMGGITIISNVSDEKYRQIQNALNSAMKAVVASL